MFLNISLSRDRNRVMSKPLSDHFQWAAKRNYSYCLGTSSVLRCESENVSCSVMSSSLQPPWTTACQAPLSMGFSKQKYWRRLPWPSPADLLGPGNQPISLMSPAMAGRFFTTSAAREVDLPLKIQSLLWNCRSAQSHMFSSLHSSRLFHCLAFFIPLL